MEGFFSPPGDGPRILNPGAALFRRNHGSGSDGLIVKAGAEQTQGAYSIFEATMPAGASMVNPHTHLNEEAWYVVDGTLKFVIDDVEHFAGPGSYLLAPRGVVHSYGNPSDSPAKYLVIFSAPKDLFWRALTELRMAAGDAELDWDEVIRVFEQHGETPPPRPERG